MYQEEKSDIIEDRHLGKFRLTGEMRPPKVGEYYLCEKSHGIARAVQAWAGKRRILERLPKGGL